MTVAGSHTRVADTLGDVTRWFFDDYLRHWESVASGTRREGPEFILGYWDCPLHVSSPRMNRWLTEPHDVMGLLAGTHARLREGGYTHTAVLDSRMTVFHPGAVAIEVILSRRAGETEIERVALHFQAVRNREGWRAIDIQETGTTARSLDELWPAHAGQHRGRDSPRGLGAWICTAICAAAGAVVG